MNADQLLAAYLSLSLTEKRKFDEMHARAAGHRKDARSLAAGVMGKASSQIKAAAARRNGAKGGRPKRA